MTHPAWGEGSDKALEKGRHEWDRGLRAPSRAGEVKIRVRGGHAHHAAGVSGNPTDAGALGLEGVWSQVP